MPATDVLTRLRSLGVTVAVAGDKLSLEPASRIPPELLAAVRECKPELLSLLQRRAALSQRLSRGAAWLNTRAAELEQAGTPLDAAFARAMMGWAGLEDAFRDLGGSGCALADDGPCPPSSDVRCQYCKAALTTEDAYFEALFAKVQRVGLILLWSDTLQDNVAFVRSEADLPKVPPGFTPYLDSELKELFPQGKPSPTPGHLRFVHAAKKLAGARVTGHDPALRGQGATEATIPTSADAEGGPEAGSAPNAS